MADDVEDLIGEDLIGDAPDEDFSHPFLTAEQVKKARADALAKVNKERVSAAMKAVLDAEVIRLEREEGMTTGGSVNDEMVRLTLDLAPFQKCLVVNFREYHSGQTYTVPRHVANSLREMQANGWRHERTVEGKSLDEQYRRADEAVISGVKGVQSRFAALRGARKAA